MNNLKISVITPSYNQGKFIEETINSIISQSYKNFEYIIIDGGSTDETLGIIEKYSSYLHYWVSESDDGQTNAINKGFMHASGDIFCWINSDDVLLPGSLKLVADYFKLNPQVNFVNGDTVFIDSTSKILLRHFIPKQSPFWASKGIYYCSQQSMFWRKGLFEKIGYLDERFYATMDLEFLIRIFKYNISIGQIKYPLGAIRIHSETKSTNGGQIWIDNYNMIAKLHPGYFKISPSLFYLFLFRVFKSIQFLYFKQYLYKVFYKSKTLIIYDNR